MQNKIITHLNFARGFRGGERQTLLLIKELSNRGYIQKIITRKESELAHRLQGIPNLEIIQINKPYIFSLDKIKGSTLLHAHETKGAQFCYFANKLYQTPYIITRRVNNPIKNNFFNKTIYEQSLFTVVLSSAIKEQMLRISQNVSIKTIPSAYTQLKINHEEVIRIKNKLSNKFIIGNIGELETHKGQYYLIEAMKKLEKKYPNIHLILLGRGKDEQNYKEQSKELSNVTFEGFVDNVGDYISSLDLFVFPSLNEGLGSILLDAIQAKVPIAASNVGGIPDIIQHNKNGLLFPPKDTQAIFDAIEKLYLSEELRKKFTSNAYQTINDYSFNTMTDKYIALYQSRDNDQ